MGEDLCPALLREGLAFVMAGAGEGECIPPPCAASVRSAESVTTGPLRTGRSDNFFEAGRVA